MIRVGTSISNLGKDWKDQLTEAELQSLQYKVSLNGVREEIQHILDSKIARHGQLTLHQMYRVVKKYEDHSEVELAREKDKGVFIPSFLEEALGGDGTFKLRWPTPCKHKRSRIGNASSASHWTIL